MDIITYVTLLYEAFLNASIIPYGSDVTYHAMRLFGGYNMVMPVILSVIGATGGQLLSYLVGKGLQRLKYTKNMTLSEDAFVRFEYYYSRYGIILLLFSWVPNPVSIFFAILAGFSNAPIKRVIALLMLGYFYHYGITLMLPA